MSKGQEITELDVSGHKCPIPVLRLRKLLEISAPGTYIRVRATDEMTLLDIPHFCDQAGHRLEEQTEENGAYIYVVQKSGTQKTG
ncbi:sulfurtransferase TusA family protein [Emcibacter nanhaiensis]|uniref:Sulfurtransferase TusA family protein n=1 Tax=Emcibacter nanhaiensis TaxID=1505037 RepID=A0A501PNT5_9PROT|nr:sulfurtransferase TusA family protein [Emcibacter nanhaiensis]TPD61772.1 sulfurtransferase TusA family protein [Emcibacter nanhaiensis]